MKTLTLLLFYFCTLVLPASASATLFTYDLSVVMLAGYLANPVLFGDVTVGVSFPQETTLDYPQAAFSLHDLPSGFFSSYSINGYRNGGVWSLSEISPTDYRFWINDPGGNIQFDLFYDQLQSPNAPFREPDRLLVNFSAELGALPGVCDTVTTFPCPLGTVGTHTFNQGEFSFARDHADVPEPASMLLAGAGFVGLAIIIRRRTKP